VEVQGGPRTFEISPVTLEEIREARERIRGLACETPLKPSFHLSERLGRRVFLKLETAQPTGAFKIRGAANAVLSLPPEKRALGVVTMSSGNHGRALAYVAQKVGIPAVICLSEQVPPVKVEAIRSLGAEVLVCGPDQETATEYALSLAEERGQVYVSPFDDRSVIAGQGTIALEILEQCPEVDTLVVQVSGGGLMSGIGIGVRSLQPEVKLLGVSQESGAAMYQSMAAGTIVEVEELPSLADALQGGIPPDNRYTFDLCRTLIDRMFLLDEDQLGQAMAHAFLHERLVLEGGGAAALGVLLQPESVKHLGQTVVAICTGDNVDPVQLLKLVDRYGGLG